MSNEAADAHTGLYLTNAEDLQPGDPVEQRGGVPDGELCMKMVDATVPMLRRRALCMVHCGKEREREDGLRALKTLDKLLRWMALFRQQRLAGEDSTYAAVKVGLLMERSGIRLMERYARAGRASVEGGRAGSNDRHGDTVENYTRIIALVEDRMAASSLRRKEAMKRCADESKRSAQPFSYGTARRAFDWKRRRAH